MGVPGTKEDAGLFSPPPNWNGVGVNPDAVGVVMEAPPLEKLNREAEAGADGFAKTPPPPPPVVVGAVSVGFDAPNVNSESPAGLGANIADAVEGAFNGASEDDADPRMLPKLKIDDGGLATSTAGVTEVDVTVGAPNNDVTGAVGTEPNSAGPTFVVGGAAVDPT